MLLFLITSVSSLCGPQWTDHPPPATFTVLHSDLICASAFRTWDSASRHPLTPDVSRVESGYAWRNEDDEDSFFVDCVDTQWGVLPPIDVHETDGYRFVSDYPAPYPGENPYLMYCPPGYHPDPIEVALQFDPNTITQKVVCLPDSDDEQESEVASNGVSVNVHEGSTCTNPIQISSDTEDMDVEGYVSDGSTNRGRVRVYELQLFEVGGEGRVKSAFKGGSVVLYKAVTGVKYLVCAMGVHGFTGVLNLRFLKLKSGT